MKSSKMNQPQPSTTTTEAALQPVSAEKTATGVLDTCSEANLRQTQTFTPKMRWGVRYSQSDPAAITNRFDSLSFPESLYGYARANPFRYLDPLGLNSEQCCECPSQRWSVFGGGWERGFLFWGKARYEVTYTCKSDAKVKLKAVLTCKFGIVGAVADIGGFFSLPYLQEGAIACNRADLLGTKDPFIGADIGLFLSGGASGSSDGVGTVEVGFGFSWGTPTAGSCTVTENTAWHAR
ncbi:MAG: hypothetical protein DRQ45_05830 [Gammaproteobacteria bacterium]|nr:MAG: hypothetical protein DRQ45_05830 [Gammaproteobacteria bacterium]